MRRVFLLENSDILDILTQNNIKYKIQKNSKFYIYFNPDIFYEKVDDEYYFTHIYNGNANRIASTNIEFDKAKKNDKIGLLIKKDRIIFDFNENQYFLDIFYKDLNSLVLLSAEFLDDESANSFSLADVFKDFVIREITDLKEYFDKTLVLYGVPEYDFDTDKAFEIYTKNPKLNINFPSYLSANRAFLFILKLIFEKLKELKSNYCINQNDDCLHKIRILLRKSRIILKWTKKLFDEEKNKELLELLKNITEKTDKKRNIDIFNEFLKNENADVILINYMQKYADDLAQRLVTFFQSKEFDEFLDKFSEFINLDFVENEMIIKNFIAKILLKQMKIIKQSLKKLNENTQDDEFHQIRLEFKKLRYILEYFDSNFDDKNIKRCKKNAKKMQDIFGKLQDNNAYQNIIEMFQNSNLKNDNILNFFSNLNLKIENLNINYKNKILIERKKVIANLNKNIKILKIYKEI